MIKIMILDLYKETAEEFASRVVSSHPPAISIQVRVNSARRLSGCETYIFGAQVTESHGDASLTTSPGDQIWLEASATHPVHFWIYDSDDHCVGVWHTVECYATTTMEMFDTVNHRQ